MELEEKTFYRDLGRRIAQYRKGQSITQQQMADRLGIAQQTLAHYEVGRLRISVALLLPLADELGLTVVTLLGQDATKKKKRGPTSKLEQQLRQITQLPKAKQRFVMEFLDNVLQQAS